MLKLRMKQLLALFLCGLLVRPMPVVAEPAAAVLGTVTSRGLVRVGDVPVPGMSALFTGDQVRTGVGNALIQYQDGVRVILGPESLASFSTSRVELQKGQMSFSTESEGPHFAASTLRLEPVSAKSAANVMLSDHKATVAVTEGSVRVVDPSGVQLASLRAGEARLFEEASAAAPSPAPPAAAAPPSPQIGGGTGTSRAWLLALGIGVVGASLGIAGLVRANDADDRADQAAADANQAQADAQAARAQITQVQTQLAAAQAQVTALQAQITSLQGQLAALNTTSAQQQARIAELATAFSELNAVQVRLSSTQSQLTQLLTSIAAQGGVATSAQLSQLNSLGATLNSLFQALQTIVNEINEIVGDLGGTISPTRLP